MLQTKNLLCFCDGWKTVVWFSYLRLNVPFNNTCFVKILIHVYSKLKACCLVVRKNMKYKLLMTMVMCKLVADYIEQNGKRIIREILRVFGKYLIFWLINFISQDVCIYVLSITALVRRNFMKIIILILQEELIFFQLTVIRFLSLFLLVNSRVLLC
jgi:hypothetical protein